MKLMNPARAVQLMNKILMLLALMLVVGVIVWPVETFLEKETKAFVELIILLDGLKVQIPLFKLCEKSGLSGDNVFHGDVSSHLRAKHRLLGDRRTVGI